MQRVDPLSVITEQHGETPALFRMRFAYMAEAANPVSPVAGFWKRGALRGVQLSGARGASIAEVAEEGAEGQVALLWGASAPLRAPHVAPVLRKTRSIFDAATELVALSEK